ncbi:MAG: DUF5655 domain-containing protein [Anaerolineales bacterium]|jgi:hypothetical protein|nr:DUF5655 domain-containing protein [Anaerolineales bacterium]
MNDGTLLKKLNLKIGQRVLLLDPPTGYAERLDEVRPELNAVGIYDFVQLFVPDSTALAARWAEALAVLGPQGALWICYPKIQSGLNSDLTRDAGWEPVFKAGYRPVTQIAIDETWSALRFKPAAFSSEAEQVDALFSGKKAALRPVYEKILSALQPIGEFTIQPRQAYIGLARKQQFAAVKPSTPARLDLGLRLKDPATSPRLEPAQGVGGGSINYKVSLHSPGEVDAQVVEWLRQAYERAR